MAGGQGARGASRAMAAPDGATPAKGSPQYRRARHDRGAETRQRLVEAALDVFGRYGFEGATTRQIAREAKANLAAIVYHFGSKEALHLSRWPNTSRGGLQRWSGRASPRPPLPTPPQRRPPPAPRFSFSSRPMPT